MGEVWKNEAPGAPGPAPPGAELEIRLRGPATARARAWKLLGDTDWMNRVMGQKPVRTQEVVQQHDGLPAIEGEISGPAGLAMPYREVWTSWAHGEYFRQVRDVHSPLLRRTDYHARLHTVAGDGDRVEPEIQLRLTVPSLLGPAVRLTQLRTIRQRLRAALAALGAPQVPARTLPVGAQAALAAWAERSPPELVADLRELLERGRPTELRRLRAFALAERWGRDRDRTLEAMLHGVEVGALELYWSVQCERCYGSLAESPVLSDLPEHAECPSCRIGFGADLGANVEALFAPHPSIVGKIEERFCTLYPQGAPELYGVFTLGPDQTLEQTLRLPAGRWRLGVGGALPDTPIEVTEDASADALDWIPEADPARLRPGAVTLTMHNTLDSRARLYLTRGERQGDRVLAAYLTNHPTFRARMGHQALSADTRVSVRAVTLMFTDLSGSTAMYEALGDASAFALVRDHFAVLREAVAAHQGAVVKTIGDAVMASFSDPGEAARCALRMQLDFERWTAGLDAPLARPLKLKVGVHAGPALVVHSDALGLDYFGGTVNLAARTEGAAGAGEIIWTEPVQRHPAVAALLDAHGLSPEPLERSLKGLKAPTRLYRLTVDAIQHAPSARTRKG